MNRFKQHTKEPWYGSAFLVALVLFWGLFPPIWFFAEYLAFDNGLYLMNHELQTAYEKAVRANDTITAGAIKKDFLGATKTYADMALKIWVAVGAALGAVIGLSKPK